MEMNQKLKEKFEEFCKSHNLTGQKKARLKKKLMQILKKVAVEPGTAIGVLSAQSISEPATQMTMRSYTLASQTTALAKVTHGLPRMIEIFDARKTFERSMIIYLKPKYNNKNYAKKFAEKIKEKKVKDSLASSSIDLLNMQLEFIFAEKINFDTFKKIVKNYMKDGKITRKGQTVYIKPDDAEIKNLRSLKFKLLDAKVGGIKNILSVAVKKEKNDWVITAEGSNLKAILELEEVDVNRTKTNDIYEVESVLGIEAARNLILEQASETLRDQGLSVDIRHLLLIADTMTFDGKVSSIGRYGVAGHKASVLARANFEDTIKHLVNASFRGERDNLNSTIENVMIGKVAPVGTGFVKLVIDADKLKGKK